MSEWKVDRYLKCDKKNNINITEDYVMNLQTFRPTFYLMVMRWSKSALSKFLYILEDQ